MNLFKKYKTGLVLSGGGARGFAHVGVIKAMEERNMKADVVAGTSAGAIVGAFYADGWSSDEILDIFEKKRIFDFAKVTIPRNGLLDISGLREVLKNNLKAKTFDELKMPLFVAVTNFVKNEIEYLHEGDLPESVVASSSIPVVFTPAKIGNKIYVDGGILDNMPLKPIDNLAKEIIGVHVNPVGERQAKGLIDIAIRTFHMSVAAGLPNKRPRFKYFIEPMALRDYFIMDIAKGKKMYELGYEEAVKVFDNK